MLQKQFYFLSPVEVVKVTLQNLGEVAEWCGGKVAAVESRRVPGRMDSYVWVPTPEGTAISWAFPGMFVTKRLVRTVKDDLRVTYAVYRKDYFEKNYFDNPLAAVDATWEREARSRQKQAKKELKENPLKEMSQAEIVKMPAEQLKKALGQEPANITININVADEPTLKDAVETIQSKLGATEVPQEVPTQA